MRATTKTKQGVALVLTLAMLVLITILVVGLSSLVTTERSTAISSLEHQKAVNLAEMSRDHAVAVLRDGIEGGRAQGKIWASQPGNITVFNTDGTVDAASSRALSSGTDSTLPVVDLNKPTFSGNNPIASANSMGTTTAPTMAVNWVNVLNDPTAAAGVANPVIGRYAFWVDDESSKINVNTADGTSKYVDPDYAASASSTPVSYGNGTPMEVSLQALTNSASSSYLSASIAESIASVTGVRSGSTFSHFLSSPSEILQPTGVPSTLYQDNNFNLTYNSRSPEENIFGEPKIYTLTVATPPDYQYVVWNTYFVNTQVGAYWPFDPGYTGPTHHPTGVPLRQVYPSSNPYIDYLAYYPGTRMWFKQPWMPYYGDGNQLPLFQVNPAIANGALMPSGKLLPQYGVYDNASGSENGEVYTDTPRFELGMRIAQYLKGYNSQGNAITWPPFPGSRADGNGLAGFAGKYTDRQIDSITLQILDLVYRDTIADINYPFSYQGMMPRGWLSNLPVAGLGRMPLLNQVMLTFKIEKGNPTKISCQAFYQWYFPKEFKGAPLDRISGWNYSPWGPNGTPIMNYADYPGTTMSQLTIDPVTNNPIPSQLGVGHVGKGFWMNQMLQDVGQDGLDAGIDWAGNDPNAPDPDPVDSAFYHPTKGGNGAGFAPGGLGPALIANHWSGPTTYTQGDFRIHPPTYTAYTSLRSHDPANPHSPPDLTKVKFTGGVAVWGVEQVPLDSTLAYNNPDWTDPKTRPTILSNVIPLPPGGVIIPMPDPADPFANETSVSVLMKVADPMVNQFPGDWISQQVPTPSDPSNFPPPITMKPSAPTYEYSNGANPEFQAAGGGDPSAYWLPEVNQNIPKSARFPSVGYFQYIRTGIMPDPANDPNDPRYVATINGLPNIPHGTPFRLLSMAPSYDPAQYPTIAPNPSQTTDGGGCYPDWAMLDLFTSPVSPQPLLGTETSLPPYLEMTYGGSTPGRVNINGVGALKSFGGTSSRKGPLQAVFKDLQYSTSYAAATATDTLETPISATVDEKAVAAAISAYQATLKDSNDNPRPFMMPGEVANVPALTNYLYDGTHNGSSFTRLPVAAVSRNDVLRQSLGNLTTQSNTFSVWSIGQTIRKRPGNTVYGSVETSDSILGEARTHYIVERYIDLGTDGVPGNAKPGGAGSDGFVGTPDDVVEGDDTPGHIVPGANPKMTYPLPYKYRVIASDEIAN